MGMVAELPERVLSEYTLDIENGETIKDGETIKNCCRIQSANGSYAVWKYQGELGLLQKVLEWRERLVEKGFTEFLRLYKTKNGKNMVQAEEYGYYVTTWPSQGYTYFDPEKSEQASGLIKVVEALSRLHTAGKASTPPKGTPIEYPESAAACPESSEVYWLKAYQERLTDLLYFYHYLQERKLVNDFERIYVENFAGFYERGQQAIQRMVLAGSDSENNLEPGFLIGNFLPQNMLETETGIVFLNIANCPQGLPIHDLSLLMKMYLPHRQWDKEFALKLLTCYQEKSTLNNQEKHLLLAQLSFPARFCIFTEKYLHGTREVTELAADFKKYLYESFWQDRCLEQLENYLWGE